MIALNQYEVEQVSGGILPLIAAFVGGAVAGAAFAYYNAH